MKKKLEGKKPVYRASSAMLAFCALLVLFFSPFIQIGTSVILTNSQTEERVSLYKLIQFTKNMDAAILEGFKTTLQEYKAVLTTVIIFLSVAAISALLIIICHIFSKKHLWNFIFASMGLIGIIGTRISFTPIIQSVGEDVLGLNNIVSSAIGEAANNFVKIEYAQRGSLFFLVGTIFVILILWAVGDMVISLEDKEQKHK